MNRRGGILGAAVLALLLMQPSANATLVAPGGSCLGCSPFTPLDLGALLATTGDVAVVSGAGPAAWTGIMRAAAYADGVPGGATDGTVFIYQFVHTGGSESVNRITHLSFAGFVTDIGFIAVDPDGLPGIPPGNPGNFTLGTQPFVGADRSASGATVGFSFAAPATIDPGETSFTMVIKTNAAGFGDGLTSIINGGSANVLTFSPVPEPGFYGLLAVGMGGLIVLSRRRRRTV